jgi:mono/diheme cytochrome c family protein
MRNEFLTMVAALAVLGACTAQPGSAPAPQPAPPPAAPAPAPVAPTPPASPAPAAPSQISGSDELPPGVGREAVLKGCGGCHGIGQILTERRSREEWANTVTMMITNGAPVSEAEFDQVVAYLAAHFGNR